MEAADVSFPGSSGCPGARCRDGIGVMRELRVIAIDGSAGSGKSTLARGIARTLGVPYVNTGVMYRALTLTALQNGVDPDDGDALAELTRGLRFSLGTGTPPEVQVEGSPPSPALESGWVEDPRLAGRVDIRRFGAHASCAAGARVAQRRGRGSRHRHGGLPRRPREAVPDGIRRHADRAARRRTGSRGSNGRIPRCTGATRGTPS